MKSINTILKVYKTEGIKSVNKLKFSGIDQRDVYNITAPFEFSGETYILGRVEPRSTVEGSQIVFFKKRGDSSWVPDNACPVFTLEDPFLTRIGEEYVIGGVETKQRAGHQFLSFRTVFLKGKNIHDLKKFTHGPWGMKDIRLIEMPNGKIGVFTRPRGRKGGRGRIGFVTINSLKELGPRLLSQAPIIQGQFVKGEWGGANEIHVLKNGKLGVLGHMARYSKDKKMRFYYPMVFCFDPETFQSSTIRMIARRSELPEGEAKSPDLYNVIFPGGLIRNDDETATLYAGVGDAEAYEVTIADPFKFYEKTENIPLAPIPHARNVEKNGTNNNSN